MKQYVESSIPNFVTYSFDYKTLNQQVPLLQLVKILINNPNEDDPDIEIILYILLVKNVMAGSTDEPIPYNDRISKNGTS
jgi:hypothetical protein